MFLKIRSYIRQEDLVSMRQLQQNFSMDASALEPILARLCARGEIEAVQMDACQQACKNCADPIYYQWKGSEQPIGSGLLS